VNKRLDVLTTVGTAAPLFGMTGTVTGMIASFAGMAEAGSSGGWRRGGQWYCRGADHDGRRLAHRVDGRDPAERL
jgi:hypothetical protein